MKNFKNKLRMNIIIILFHKTNYQIKILNKQTKVQKINPIKLLKKMMNLPFIIDFKNQTIVNTMNQLQGHA